MLRIFKTKKQHINPRETNVEKIKEKANDQKQDLTVYAMQILSIADIKRTIDFLDSGNIVLVSLNPLKKRNVEKANEFLRRLIEYTKSAKANVLLIGNGYLAISPPQILINKIKHDEKENTDMRLDEKKQA